MAVSSYTFQVFRFDPQIDAAPRFDTFTLDLEGEHSILGSLQDIQDRFDPSLAFRYSCRGAVCGSCAMCVNGTIVLACRTLLKNLPAGPIVLEPLPNLEVQKDLAVDLEPFWRAYREIEPWLHSKGVNPEKENRVSEEDVEKIDQFIPCILCACCYGACPVPGRDHEYLGPAALAKLYRFVGDVRDHRGKEGLAVADSEHGVWGCDTVFKCIEACPKNVRPTDGIAALRRRMVGAKISRKG